MRGSSARPAMVEILGTVRATGPEGEIDLGGRKPRALLARLLIDAGRVVSTDRLIDAVWGDDPPNRVEVSLQSYVSRLRRALDGLATITSHGAGYRIGVEPDRLDVARAEAQVGEGRLLLASGDLPRAAAVLTEAVGWWRGRPLDEFADEEWARAESVRLTELRMAAWEDLADARLTAGDHRHLVADLEALVAEAPYREGLVERLVVALGRSGRPVEALATLRRHREILLDELGLDPGPRLVQLEHDLLSQSPSITPASAVAVPAASSPADAAVRSPLPGRRRELAEIAEVLAATGGRGGVVVITGGPGIGKSAVLARAVDDAVAAGHHIVRVRGAARTSVPPLLPWRLALEDLAWTGDELRQAAGPDAAALDHVRGSGSGDGDALPASSYAVGLAVARVLVAAAARRPTLVAVDDLPLLDPASLAVLQFVAGETTASRLSILVTARRDEAEASRAAAACVTELLRAPGARQLPLDGLDTEATALVAAEVAGRPVATDVVGAVRERTGGNPFLIRELVRQLLLRGQLHDVAAAADPAVVPPSVLDAVRRRTERLPEDVAEVLRLAAVAGGDVRPGLLAAAGSWPVAQVVDALDRACASELLQARPGGGLGFSHSLVAEALVESLTPIGRSRRHLALLGALRAVTGSPASALAHHAVGALPLVDTAEAVRLVAEAAGAADRAGAHEEAAGWWRRALEVLDQPGALEWAARDGLARALLAAGDLGAGLRTVLEACTAAERLGDVTRLATSASAVVQPSLWPWRNYGEVDRRMVRALERSAATLGHDRPQLEARVLAALGVERYYGDDVAAGDEASQRAVEAARRADDPVALALALNLRFLAIWRPDRFPEMEATAEELVRLSEEADLDDATLFVGTFLRLVARLTLGRAAEAAADERACIGMAERLRTPALLVVLTGYRAMRASLDGDFDAVDRWVESGQSLLRRTQVWPAGPVSLGLLAPVSVERGGAVDLATQLLAGGGRLARVLGCHLLAEAGARHELEAELARRGPLADPPPDWAWLASTCAAASVAVAVGEGDRAHALADRLAPHHGRLALFGSDGCLGAVDEFVARCRALREDPRAEEAFERALTLHRQVRAPHLEARTLVHQARWLRATGRPAEAGTALERATRLARTAPALLERVRAEGSGARRP